MNSSIISKKITMIILMVVLYQIQRHHQTTIRSSYKNNDYEDDFENYDNKDKIEVIESRSGTNICISCKMTLVLIASYNKNCQIYMIKKDVWVLYLDCLIILIIQKR
jgi:hypothetical protein